MSSSSEEGPEHCRGLKGEVVKGKWGWNDEFGTVIISAILSVP